jgi:penicillin amidase
MAWTALADDDLTMQAALRVARAGNWPDFVAALRSHHLPQQTFVYADVDGNTGMYAAGRVPIRKPENDLLGLAPAPGWKAAYDWDGFIPFDELPHAFNPPSGTIVAANQKIVAEDYPHHITRDWAMPYRARRIGELLAARPEHSVASFARLQADVRSPLAADFLPLLLAPEAVGAAAAAAREKLSSWDGAMDREQPEPLIFAAWYRELTRLVYADELGPLFKDVWGPKPVMMRNALSRQQGWCDDVATELRESCAERIAAALNAALSRLQESYGQDMEAWRWGEAHPAHGSHRPFSLVPSLGPLFDIELPAGGGSYTVNTAVYGFADRNMPFVEVHGPTFRAIYDLDDLDRSRFMVSTGQSGNVFSRHYSDLAEPWRDVAYIPMTTNRATITAAAGATLVLLPAANPDAE